MFFYNVISKWKVTVFFYGVKCKCLPPPLKWLNFTFYNISSSLLMLSAQKSFLVRQKYVCFEKKKKVFLMGNQKWQKNFEFHENSPKWPNCRVRDFQILKFKFFLSFLVSHQKNFFFLKANILLSYQKKFWVDNINREKDIL